MWLKRAASQADGFRLYPLAVWRFALASNTKGKSMWIRNKGTAKQPCFVLVQSRRIVGKKHPQLVEICRMGKFSDFDDLIKIWEVVAKDARTAKRANMPERDRNKQFPTVKTYAPRLSLKEINARLDKIKWAAEKYADFLQAKANRSSSQQSFNDRPQELIELAILIARIREGDLTSRWKPALRTQVKNMLGQLLRQF